MAKALTPWVGTWAEWPETSQATLAAAARGQSEPAFSLPGWPSLLCLHSLQPSMLASTFPESCPQPSVPEARGAGVEAVLQEEAGTE